MTKYTTETNTSQGTPTIQEMRPNLLVEPHRDQHGDEQHQPGDLHPWKNGMTTGKSSTLCLPAETQVAQQHDDPYNNRAKQRYSK